MILRIHNWIKDYVYKLSNLGATVLSTQKQVLNDRVESIMKISPQK